MFAAGPPVVPVPVRVTDCGLPVELSAKEIAAVRCPAAVGLNRPLIVQFEPAATEMSQLRCGGGGHYHLPKSVCAETLSISTATDCGPGSGRPHP